MPNITGQLEDFLGTKLTHGQLLVEFYGTDARVDGSDVRLGPKRYELKDLPNPLTLDAGSYRFHFATAANDASPNGQRPKFTPVSFAVDLTADTTWGAIFTNAVPLPPEISDQAAQILAQMDEKVAQQEAIAGLTGEDDAVTFLANSPTSDLYAALVAGFARGQVVTHPRWGAGTSKTAAQNTAAIQACIDWVAAQPGKGVVYVPEGTYSLGASTLSETFDNDGVAVAATTNCLVLRKGVSLFGAGVDRTVFAASVGVTVMAIIAPDSQTFSDFTVQGTGPTASAAHGLLTLATAGGADRTIRNTTFRNLLIRNVGSYGIGLQQGYPVGCRIDNVTVDNIGADGLDLKARAIGGTPIRDWGNYVTNVRIYRHGQRVTGSAGIDVRGIWHLSGVTVADFGSTGALDYAGIRFRTKIDGAGGDLPEAAAKSSLTQFTIRAHGGSTGNIIGITSGSDDVSISQGTIENCDTGVALTGNAVGTATRNRLANVVAINSTVYGFHIGTGCSFSLLQGCYAMGSGTAGYRNDGTGTVFVGCDSPDATPISVPSGPLESQMLIGGGLSAFEDGISVSSVASGRVNVNAVGPSANIDLVLAPKGGGRVRMAPFTASADAAIVGYMSFKDETGVLRRVAVIA